MRASLVGQSRRTAFAHWGVLARARRPARVGGQVPSALAAHGYRLAVAGSRRRPRYRGTDIAVLEMLPLRAGEVLGQAGNEVRDGSVGGEGDFPDLEVVIAHEASVSKEAGRILPTWKLSRVDDDPMKAAVRLDPRVHRRRQSIEVGGPQRACNFDDHDRRREACDVRAPSPAPPTRATRSRRRGRRSRTLSVLANFDG
jgi:hypothetical protein